MQNAPLVPLQDPLVTLSKLGLTIPQGSGTMIVLAIVFGIWLIYTLVVTYHWLKYSHGSMASLPALFVHLVISAVIMSYALSGSLLPTL